MRKLKWSLTAMLLLAGCAGSGDRASTIRQGLTNYENEEGIPYVTNGDDFADAQAKLPTTAGKSISQKIPKDSLGDRIREYEFTRWDDKAKTKKDDATRFGTDHWALKVLFRHAHTVEFKGTFGKTADGKLTLIPTDKKSRYTIKESVLTDEITPYEKTRLHFTLTDTRRKDSVVVSYYAFLGNFETREDESNKAAPGSVFECQLKALKESTLAWVNNWTTLPGRVFFYNDLVHTGNVQDATQNCLPSKISIRGESLATALPSTPDEPIAEGATLEHKVASTLGDVSLIGNARQGNRRMFMAALEDKQSGKTNNVVMTVTPQDPKDNEVTDDESDDGKYDANGNPADDGAYDRNGNPVTPPRGTAPAVPNQTPARPSAPAAPSRPSVRTPPLPPAGPGDAYLSTVAGPRAARQVRDFEANRDLKQVRFWINQYTNKKAWKAQLQSFYDNAAPFRAMMQGISRAVDVIGWAYLAAVESKYFTADGYTARIRGDFSREKGYDLAWGPFQMHEAAAQSSGLIVTRRIPSDERDYFAPEACGAAVYYAQQVQAYKADSTVAILGYNQGEAGAAARIYCGYHSSQAGQQKACADNIKSTSRKQYGLYIQLAKNFSYTFRGLASFGVLTDPMIDYVSKKLALYFISLNPGAYGFSMNTGKRSLPTNGTVFPPSGQPSSQMCRDAIKGTY